MEKVYSIVRQIYGRSPTDDFEWPRREQRYMEYFHECHTPSCSSSRSRLFGESTIYQESTPEIGIPSDWKVDQGSDRNHRSDHDWLQRTYVEIDDSSMWQSDWDYECQNLCLRRLGALSWKYQWPIVFGKLLSQRSESNWWRANEVRVENIRRIHYIGHSRRDSKNMTDLQCEPEQFNGRIIFMSMYNDIVWGERGNTEKCIVNSVTVANHARRLARTLVIFGTWIREEMVRNMLWNQTEIGTKLLS